MVNKAKSSRMKTQIWKKFVFKSPANQTTFANMQLSQRYKVSFRTDFTLIMKTNSICFVPFSSLDNVKSMIPTLIPDVKISSPHSSI